MEFDRAKTKEKLSRLPQSPGVYFMKDSLGEVLYVGKAKNLRSRVSSYFISSNNHSPKTLKLVRRIQDFEVILVATESESLLLERTLIKHHLPPFNILLRDDKEYPYVRIQFNDQWPKLDVVRRKQDDGAEYYGPFTSPSHLRLGLEAVRRVFPLIRCSEWEFKNAKRVCNYYHMKLCLGPCVLPVDPVLYQNMLRDSMRLVQGDNDDLLVTLTERMSQASKSELYEIAAQYRDQIASIRQLGEKQSVILDQMFNFDVVAWQREEEVLSVAVLMIRKGRLLGQDSFVLTDQGPDDENLSIRHFFLQYFDSKHANHNVYITETFEGINHLEVVLMSDGQASFRVIPSITSNEVDKELVAASTLVQTAMENARYRLKEATKAHDKAKISLEALQNALKLSTIPRRIECIDISNLQEMAIVASNVCFIDGSPDKSLYRLYNIRSVSTAPDDYASIEEVVTRRIERGVKTNDLPDLLVIDGGKGQLNAALNAKAIFPGCSLKIVSLAKSRAPKNRKNTTHLQKDMNRSFERIFYDPNQPALPLAPGSPVYRIMTQIRDEAHRFALMHHRRKRAKLSSASPLDQITGIGPKIKQELLKRFGGIEGIRLASIDQLLKVKGVHEELALTLKTTFDTDE